jgi:hypothetical protein
MNFNELRSIKKLDYPKPFLSEYNIEARNSK